MNANRMWDQHIWNRRRLKITSVTVLSWFSSIEIFDHMIYKKILKSMKNENALNWRENCVWARQAISSDKEDLNNRITIALSLFPMSSCLDQPQKRGDCAYSSYHLLINFWCLQLSKLWWIPNSVSRSAIRTTVSSRQFQRYPTTQL